MGAYWNVLLPYKFSIPNKKEYLDEFEKKYGKDFVYEKTRNYVRESPLLPNGKRLKWQHEDNDYLLPLEIIRKEFVPFYRTLLQEWDKLYLEKFEGEIVRQTDGIKNLEEILAEIEEVLQTTNLYEEKVQDKISKTEARYWLRSESLMPFYMYEGYPLKNGEGTSMECLVLWHSYEKMNLYVEETLAIHSLVDILKAKYSDTFVLARYLCVGGY